MAITEPTINTKLAEVLRGMHPRWSSPGVLRSQQTQRIVGQPGRQPDLELDVLNAAPVVIEAEIEPARTVESDAKARLGAPLAGSPMPVETVVALKYPARFKSVAEALIETELTSASDLQWALLTEHGGRRPTLGWVAGTVADLASMLEVVALSPRVLNQAADTLEQGITAIAAQIEKMPAPTARTQIAVELHQDESEQTWRMAASILANAYLFQEAVSGYHNTPNMAMLEHTGGGSATQSDTLQAWQQVLKINYWPIFNIARRILLTVPTQQGDQLCEMSSHTAKKLAAVGATQIQNMTGQMFGQLITDRKFLATFYTLPSSARMLAELATDRLGVDWLNREAVTELKVADFACGTGALLSAVYETITSRIRRAGGDDAAIHSEMIERVLVGADIMPAAAHLTTTMLSTVNPEIPFARCGIHVVPYGKQSDKSIAIGSLDLLRDRGAVSLFPTAKQISGTSGPSEQTDIFVLADESCDLVIMNPPFTRPTNHEQATAQRAQGKTIPPVPSFGGFGTTAKEQKEMSDALKKLINRIKSDRNKANRPMGKGDWASHGNAGLASNFVDLANAKLKPGGTLALVLPLPAVSGPAWQNFRQLIDHSYDNLQFVTIASAGSTDRAFSADTGMAETLLVATKRINRDSSKPARCGWVSLIRRPRDLVESVWFANAIQAAAAKPGVAAVSAGNDTFGYHIGGTIDDAEFAGIAEPEVAQCAHNLQSGSLLLAGHPPLNLPITTLGQLGDPGPVHRDINETGKKSGVNRGPFDLEPTKGTVSYPILWEHSVASGRESAMEVQYDHSGRIRHQMRDKAINIWRTATRLHINTDFQLNSQPLGACMTPIRVIGGRAWPSFRLEDPSWEPTICVWLNTTFGLIARWSISNRQQQGRASISVSTLEHVPVIDPQQLMPSQIAALNGIFESFKKRKLKPANESWNDITRKRLDEAVADVLNIPKTALPALDILRRQWCEEPSVHGGKSTRPWTLVP